LIFHLLGQVISQLVFTYHLFKVLSDLGAIPVQNGGLELGQRDVGQATLNLSGEDVRTAVHLLAGAVGQRTCHQDYQGIPSGGYDPDATAY